ncbi:DUF1273 domain-containing protein [Oscillibacter sp. MSJ-2]|uniref:DUF1273 domain-containing protein n=1 Tax=Dysosmobacter acutus TaxID=2841504 RepID=A0ABS6F6Y3_9FIRM|nr:SLOG family protein [Dysosmobacter acutus]MBU5626040.1 DUF1273 domain-containing protein [Dysosmobacter acutus]
MDKRSVTCCFTGHRDIPRDQFKTITVRTELTIRKLIIVSGVQYFGVGGALGFDTLAAQILFRLRETDFPYIKVILVYPFEDFTSRWTDDQKDTYARMLSKYDKCVCISPVSSKEAYLARDRRLVDESSHCVAYCTRNTGGTAYTLRYAANKGGVSIHNVASDGAFC